MPDAEYWRDRAEEVRASAEAMHDPVARQALLKIAEDYEKLAERAGRRTKEESRLIRRVEAYRHRLLTGDKL